MIVQKFGGSSVQDPARIATVAGIIRSNPSQPLRVAVLSAMKGITDSLLGSAADAAEGRLRYRETFEQIRSRHLETAAALIPAPSTRELCTAGLESMLGDLKDLLHGVELVKEVSPRSLDLIAGYGERLNCFLMTHYLRSLGEEAHYIDASDNLILSDDNHGSALVDFTRTNHLVRERLGSLKGTAVVTGFIASTESGKTTTLGRNGSDYTASILGAAMKAACVEIWKDVDGVHTADPRLVENTRVVDEVSVEEAMELSYFGAEVIHPSTMLPLVEADVPLRIKNTYNPSAPGTLIAKNIKPHGQAITGIASIPEAAILNIEGGGMIGLPGFAGRVFTALAQAKANVIMISQASSEHSICIVVRQSEAEAALKALQTELALELSTKRIKPFELLTGLEIIAVIGDNMRGRPGLTGQVFSALGQVGVNILAIAQGSSERNISFVIRAQDTVKALNSIHKTFLG